MPAATHRRPPARRSKETKSDRPKITVEDLQDFNESWNILIYGDSGVGKTPLAGGGMGGDTVFLSTEKGTISAKRFGSKAKLIRATSWERVEAAFEYLRENPDGFKNVIIDSLTKMQILLVRYLLKQNVEEGRRGADIDVPQIQDHQKWQNQFKRFVDDLIDLDINCIFIATAMHKEDAEGDDLVLPHILGKDYEVCQYVCAQTDGVYCLKVEEDEETGDNYWKLLTQAVPPFFAKDRYAAHKKVVIRPTMPELIEAIENSAADAGVNKNVAKRRNRKAEPPEVEDLEDEDFEDDEDEDEPEPPKRQRRPVASRQHRKPEPDEEDEDEDEEPEPPKRARKAAKTTRKAPARRGGRKAPDPEPEDDEDEDDFDPEDEDWDEDEED